jgi:hypothetical protein
MAVTLGRNATHNAERNGVTDGRNVTEERNAMDATVLRRIEALEERMAAQEKQLDTLAALVGKTVVGVAPMKAGPSSSNAERQKRYREKRKRAHA